jgi:hypothetical protein
MSDKSAFEQEAAIAEPIGTIVLLYGDVTRQIIARGDLAEMLRLQERASTALAVLRTRSGREQAADAGISTEHIKDLRSAYRSLNRAIAKLQPKAS